MPACDTCRTRKVDFPNFYIILCTETFETRCDRKSPCSSCISSRFECTTSSRRLRVTHKSNLVLRPNNLAPLHPRVTNKADGLRRQSKLDFTTVHSQMSTPSEISNTSSSIALPNDSLVASEDPEFEGESSLHAHSKVARELLELTLDNDSYVRDNPNMVAALSSLRQIVEADKLDSSRKKLELNGLVGIRPAIYELPLPPTDAVLKLLRETKKQTFFVFSPPLSFVTRTQFDEVCKTIFFRTEDYPVSTAIIFFGTFENFLMELKWTTEELALKKQYMEWVQLCRTNLETSISNLDLLLPAAIESAQALLIAAAFCMELGRASTARKLVSQGCIMVQSLGWHRSSSMRDDSEPLRHQKAVIFWMLYTIDRNSCLRLGQASLIQDYDIDLPLPFENPSAPLAPIGQLKLWVKAARLMGLIYQKLYSPGALKQTDATRFQAVQRLLLQIEDIRPTIFDKDDLQLSALASDLRLVIFDVMFKSDEITYYSLLCMIYRATPTSAVTTYDPYLQCIKYARAALDCHAACTTTFKRETDLWTLYLHWTILKTPFVPFTTLFSHVLKTHDRVDLGRLQQFAQSMADSPASEPARKVSRLATVFVNVASLYIESREQESLNNHVESHNAEPIPVQNYTSTNIDRQIVPQPIPAWAPMDPLLHALGFTGAPPLTMDNTFNANADLENWFSGNQYIMGLLEDDMSYLDNIDFNVLT